MLNNLRLNIKLPLVILGACIIATTAIGGISYITAKNQAYTSAEANLMGLIESKKHELKTYLHSIEQDLLIVSNSSIAQNALKDFNFAWQAIGTNQTDVLKKAYIEENPHPTGQKEKLDKATTGLQYDNVHEQYHPWFRTLQQQRGYYDIFLLNMQGDLIYSVFKELDYATNLNEGEYRTSGLAEAFRAAAQSKTEKDINFFDFKPYAPSHGAAASFISKPIYQDGIKVGVLVFQMPVDNLNVLMTANSGLGETGETFLLGSDSLMRNDSKFSKQNDILVTKVENSATKAALAGKATITKETSYRGIELEYVAYPFEYRGVKWAMVAAKATSEIDAPILKMRNQVLFASLGLLALCGLIGYLLSKSITKPMSQLVKDMFQLAEGDNKLDISSTERKDEIGDIAKTLVVFKEYAQEREKLQQQKATENQSQIDRQETINHMIKDFQAEVEQSLNSVASSASQMQTHAKTVSESSSESSGLADSMDMCAKEALSFVSAASSAGEEMNAAISEIESQVFKTKDLVDAATSQAQQTDQRVSSLTEAAQKIGEIINIIQEIAEQTNLLALNATIEAARAGDSGKGFAVVASEVKGLATQTAKATEEIATQIASIQTETAGSVEAIQSVATKISEINEYTSAIASAIEEQGAATSEIARNVESTAEKTQEVSSNVQQVASSVQSTDKTAEQVLLASQSVNTEADTLKKVIDNFLSKVQAA